MANRRYDPVSYRPFRAEPILADGLLAVSRPGGELEERVAAGMFRLAEEAALAGAPQLGVEGGSDLAAGGDHRAIAANILRREEGFRETPYWDVNAYRTGYGSDTITTADGKVQRVQKDMKITRADGERDLARRLGEFEGRTVGQVGAENWNRLPANVRGALLSVSYNYGSLPRTVAAAVRGGDVGAIGTAVAGLSANKTRRGREAAIIRGGAAPAGVDPIQTASTGSPNITVAGGGYRPTNRDTIYGRAFDEAGSKTYLQMLESEMRSTASQVYDRYKDDPATLERAFGALRGELGREHVFDEIRADFEVGFGRMAENYLSQARDNYQRKVEAQERANFVERTGALSTDIAKRVADFDPASPAGADSIAAAQAAVDQHYDDAVDRGILDPDDAARAKIKARRETALAFYSKQAEAKNADDVAAMRKEMSADFAAGRLDGLDGEGWTTLDAGLEKLERSKRADAARIERDYVQQGDQMAKRLAAGYEVDPAELSKLELASSSTPGGKEAMRELYAKISAARAIRDMSGRQARNYVAGLRKQYGDTPTDGELRTIVFAEDVLARREKAIATDAVSYAEAQGIVPATPMLTDAATAEDMMTIMSSRAEAAEEAAAELGTRVRYLKAGEAKALADAVKADPAKGAAIAGAIVAGAGNRAPAVLAEFGQDAPMLAEAGAIVAFGGSARAAEDVILGYGKGVDGKQRKGLKPDEARTSFSAVAGGALALSPKDSGRIERAAASIARKRITEEALDPESDEARAVHAQAVQEAAGAVFDRGEQFGGFAEIGGSWFTAGAKVLVPTDIRADLFGDLIAAVTDEDLAALPVQPRALPIPGFRAVPGQNGPAWTLRRAVPVAVAGGYAFALGDPASDDPQFVQGSDGKIFVLDILAMRDRLAPRVPGAFR